MTLDAVLFPLLRWLTLAAMVFTCARLLHSGLYRRYWIFFLFLAFSSLRSALLLVIDVKSGLYMQVWLVTEPVRWILLILMVLELYSLILDKHRGLLTVGRWALMAAIGVALLISVATLIPDSSAGFVQSRLFGFYLVVQRALLVSLLVFLLLVLWFLSRYPVVLSRNVIVHSVVYSAYFVATSLVFLLRSTWGIEVARPINLVLMAASAACALVWAICLTPAGEKTSLKSRPQWAPGDEKRLLEQLDALNASLLRATRK
jgi:hypothetical protein